VNLLGNNPQSIVQMTDNSQEEHIKELKAKRGSKQKSDVREWWLKHQWKTLADKSKQTKNQI